MKYILTLFTLLLCTAFTAKGERPDPENLPELIFRCQGIDRSYYLYLPEDLPSNAPLVFYLHGYGNEKPTAVQLCNLADKEKYAVCIPHAAIDPNGKHGWNVGYNMQKGYKVDDILFLKKLTRHLSKKYGLSRVNVFVTGVSNGGEMCYLIAYREPDFFRAVAPKSGLTMKWMYENLSPQKPVPLLEIHGTEDRVSEWNGDLKDEYWGPYIAVPLAVANWATAARCDHEVTQYFKAGNWNDENCSAARAIGGTPTSRHDIIAHRYLSDTNGGIEVSLYEIVGAGHSIGADDFDYASVVWNFFKRYLIIK